MATTDRQQADELLRAWTGTSQAARELFKRNAGLVDAERTFRAHAVVHENAEPAAVKTVVAIHKKDG
jgi:hypothetical protein